MFRKGWFRFVVELLITIAVIGLFLILVIAFMNTDADDILNMMVFGSFSMVGMLIFSLCFDQLIDWDEGLLGILRKILFIVGTLIIAVCGGLFSYLVGYADDIKSVTAASPWLQGFVTCWIVGGELTFVLYELGLFDNYEFLFPFVPIISEAAGYIVGVIFAYIGGATVIFCYWIPFILSAVGFVAIIVCLVRKKFNRSKREKTLSRPSYSDTPYKNKVADAADALRDTRKEYNGERPIKSAIYDHVLRDTYGCLSDLNLNKLSHLSADVRVSGNVEVRYTGTFVFDASGTTIHEQDRMARSDYETTIQNIIARTRAAYEEVRSAYSGYDKRSLKIDTSGIQCVIVRQ